MDHHGEPSFTRRCRSLARAMLVILLGACAGTPVHAEPTEAEKTSAPPRNRVSEVFKLVRRAVVVVRVAKRDVVATEKGGRKQVDIQGLGSGVLVRDPSGAVRVLTAAHVVQAADRVGVETLAGSKVRARVIASAPLADVALLALETVPDDIRTVELGNSGRVEVGDRVIVVGAPRGLGHTLTVGYVSARRKSQAMPGGLEALELFQTDAAINSGNSGGPMFDMNGRVIGVVSHILTRSGGFEGLGFAVTSNLARRLVLEKRTFWWGIDGTMISGEIARALNVPQPAALLIQRIARDSPADRMGLKAGTVPAEIAGQKVLLGGDIILKIAGVPCTPEGAGLKRIRDRVQALEAGKTLEIEVLRGGTRVKLKHVCDRN